MGYTNEILRDVLNQLHPGDETITAARERRDDVLDAARTFEGALRTYGAGSIAHRTANFDTDADGGVVLDRRTYPNLGPDGGGEGPCEIVEDVREHVRAALLEKYPNLSTRLTKRAIQFKFHAPVGDGEEDDPSADLVVALTRKEPAEGLNIPNREQDRWDPSHPEKHTEILTDEPAALRRRRAHAIRLAKGENKEHGQPALSSFNIEALALESVEDGQSLAASLLSIFEYGASDLRKRRTPDPADVSPPLKTLIDREKAADRLERAGKLLREALDSDEDEEKVRGALHRLFPSYVKTLPEAKASLAKLAAAGNGAFGLAGLPAVGETQARLKSTPAFGNAP